MAFLVLGVLGLGLVLAALTLLPFWALAAFMDRGTAALACWFGMVAYLIWVLATHGTGMVPTVIVIGLLWSGLLWYLAGGSTDQHKQARAQKRAEQTAYDEWVNGFNRRNTPND